MKNSDLKLNGKQLGFRELLTESHKILSSLRTEDWEIKLYTFIQDWLDDKSYILQETSGTTGEKKQIRLLKRTMWQSAAMTCEFFHLDSSHSALLCLPVRYIAGKMMIVRALVSGMNLITKPPSGNPLEGLESVIDFSAMVPLQVIKALEHPQGLSKIRNLIIGGSEISPTLERRLRSVTETNLYATFSMTETSSHIALRKLNGIDASTYFTLLREIEISKDHRNCLVIHAPFVSRDPIVTNDLVEIKDSQHFKWLGRYDNIINSGGIKVSPEETEKKLEGLIPRRFVISSIPDERLGNQLVLVIEGPEFPKEQIKKLELDISDRISGYTKPRKILFIPHLPQTETLKINRKALMGSNLEM